MSQIHLPTDAAKRKKIPLYSGLVKYFPDALVAIAALSQAGNDQHNAGQKLHWSRDKSSDHEDTLMRHLLDAGTVDVDGHRHSTKLAWRALAKLQLEIEAANKEEAEPKDSYEEVPTPPTTALPTPRIQLLREAVRSIDRYRHVEAVQDVGTPRWRVADSSDVILLTCANSQLEAWERAYAYVRAFYALDSKYRGL